MTEQTGDVQDLVRGSGQRNGAAEASVSHRGGLYLMDGRGEGQEPLGGGRGCSQLSEITDGNRRAWAGKRVQMSTSGLKP